MLAPDSQSLFTRSPPTSPEGPRSPTSFYSSSQSPPRASRSVENFSRPVSRAPPTKPSFSPSIIPPPRSSSKFAGSPATPEPTCQNVEALLGPDHHAYPQTEIKSPRQPMELAPNFSDDEAGQACTTEDNSARALRSPLNHTPELADVPEEDESSWRNSAAPPASPPRNNLNFSFPAGFSRSSSRRPQFNKSLTSPATFLHVSAGGEEMQSPTIPSERQSHPPSAQSPAPEAGERHNKEQSAADESWEDDIDYCYEHAAESTSNFDWQRTSFEEESEAREERLATLTIHPSSLVANSTTADDPAVEEQKSVPFVAELHPPSTSASGQSTPDLQPVSAVSSSSTSQPNSASSPAKPEDDSFKPAAYPSSLSSPNESRDNLQKPASIQVLAAPFDEHVSSDPTTYEDLISNAASAAAAQDDTENTHHFPFYPTHSHPHPQPSDDPSRSSRGSGSPISKCNSQESVILSRAASIARKHRSSTSTTSVPELVHSSNCSRETVDRDQNQHQHQHQNRERDRDNNSNSVAGTSEPSRPFSPRPPVSATHWRSKTLTKEPLSASGCGGGEAATAPATPTHDRAKSASVLESQDASTSSKTLKAAAAGRGGGGATPRKTRTYSLFPVAAQPSER